MLTLEQIKKIDAQLTRLQSIINSNEHNAAGIRVQITVGGDREKCPELDFDLGIASDVNGIMHSLQQGLEDSRKYWLRNTKQERDELIKFLNDL
jgi:hypothetical protein